MKKLNNLILHIHPKTVSEKALNFTLTFGLGGMAALLFVLLAFTGILLRFVYTPTPEAAYDSILAIKNDVAPGSLIRNLHYWSATLLLVISFLHLLRVLFTGGYKGKRASNWVIGLSSLLLVILMSFTGYLLPWDQLSYWAVTVSTNMLKYIPLIGEGLYSGIVQGKEVGAPTLLVFYSLHTGLFPLTMVILLMFHFWKVRKAGGVVFPESTEEKEQKLPVWPNLVAREFVVALCLLAVLFMLSLFFDAPLKERANPLVSPNPAKAPWYFMGFQELLLHFTPIISIVIIPLGTLTLLFAFPYFKSLEPKKGVWFLSDSGKKTSIQSSILGLALTFGFILLNEFVFKTSGLPEFLKSGFLSLIILMLFLWLMIKVQHKKYNTSMAESMQAILCFLFSAFLSLTIIGNFFRGEGMALTF